MPDPSGRWLMMCSCGATEIRADSGPAWRDFDLHQEGPNLYRVTCKACGKVTAHHMREGSRGTAATATA
ncbi:hypothetical protein ACFPTY_03420 [Halomonas beimenensis]